jgi:hypothetical protein
MSAKGKDISMIGGKKLSFVSGNLHTHGMQIIILTRIVYNIKNYQNKMIQRSAKMIEPA